MYWIFGKDNCQCCKKAVELLDKLNLVYAYMQVPKDRALFGVKYEQVPQIWHNGIYIGGYMALAEYVGK